MNWSFFLRNIDRNMCVSFLQVKRKAVKKQRQRLREGLLLVIHSVAPISVAAIFLCLGGEHDEKTEEIQADKVYGKDLTL